MLIDIEKYVRQMLPPDRRLPKHVGLATLLFSPINSVIEAFNDFKYNSQFDTGTPGQVAVLEFILQNYVHSAIRVLSADGAKLDFRVLVPEGLSGEKRGEVIRLVERYRLRSKRYEVADSLDWGNGGTDPVTGLAFAFTPRFYEASPGNFVLVFGINKSEIQHLKIFNLTTGTIQYDIPNQEWIAGAEVTLVVWEQGLWRIQIGSLMYNLAVQANQEIVVKPDWITDLAITNDVNSRDTSFWLGATVDCKMKIVSPDGSPISGYTAGNAPWNSSSWIEGGESQWAVAPYTEIFRANPLSFASGGLVPGNTYILYIIRASNPNVVFRTSVTIPNTSHISPPLTLELAETGPQPQQCDFGPSITSMVSFTQQRFVWNMDARDVTKLRGHAKNVTTGQIVQSKEVTVALDVNGSLVGVFNPSWRIILDWDTPLPPGQYQFGTEGVSCSSPIYWSDTFTVIETEEPGTDPGPDPGLQLGDYILRFPTECFPGDMKLTFTPTGDGLGFLVTDTVVTVPSGSNVEVSYVINERFYKGLGRMVNFIWHLPGPLSVRKIKNETWLTELKQTGGTNAGDTVRGIEAFPYNTSYAQMDIVAVKQNA